ncbi:hypothetical protein SS1G_09323 [Sclerotinia sclerotiorum 1980 UF-70]|uniref:HTH psq-type domain-containing protein n=2 Tax=Sclerotinia sclerotiorum (strain ATCC 18683 / 1980 / Ss-1) TaxID=665079 RepID=A7EVG5_SCLS1|nr:hypothetical protein SS1G_09323 [Sclerotinia sclerotiorum 1980 UF-70]APA15815.1 hypothetical protein sscle_15g105850 [Sclerotinia sclerotiorum 1980 UF-70]EDN93457.1 hypothetical protein SS1G_09323 [Sclerotinia sclerotiorum 1980 UF-70]
MEIQSKEARIILAIEAIQKSKNLTVGKAAKIYKVPRTTLRDRMGDRIHRMETRANNLNLIEKEEEVLIQYIIDIDERGFASKLSGVEDIANYILESRDAKRVGKLWAYRFFGLVSNIQAKYSIQDCDFYNFDETGFMMGIICSGIIVISSERNGRSKAIQLGNREWATAIICGNGEGETIPPFLIVQEQVHLFN